jgi:hypothetical protein
MDKILREYLQGAENDGPCRRVKVEFEKFGMPIRGLDGGKIGVRTLKTACHCDEAELVIDTLFDDPKNRAILKCDSCKNIFRDIKTGAPFVVRNPYNAPALDRIPKVGDRATLQKCKHRWNNGLEVVIVAANVAEDEYKGKDSEGRGYILGRKNIILN